MGTYNGTPGNNTIIGSNYSDLINALGGDDVINGRGGDDDIDGGTGSDTIYGGAGNDHILGKTPGLGDWTDSDTIYGGPGADWIYGNGGEHDGYSPDGTDYIHGGDGNDHLYGKLGNDVLWGDGGNDLLGGYYGVDRMYGGAGNDILKGRFDGDVLSGGSGNDIYQYVETRDSTSKSKDIILNFDNVGPKTGDRIDLHFIDANENAGGNQAFVFIGTAAFTGPGQVRVEAHGPHTLVLANTGGSLAPELDILVRDGTPGPADWHASDFIL